MILTSAIIVGLSAVLLAFSPWLLSLLPLSQGFGPNFADSLNTAVGYLYLFDFLVPVDLVINLFLISVVFQFSLWIVRTVLMLIKLIRG